MLVLLFVDIPALDTVFRPDRPAGPLLIRSPAARNSPPVRPTAGRTVRAMTWWQEPLGELVGGRRVIVVGGPAVFWTPMVARLRELGALDVLVVATDGVGVGPRRPTPPSSSSSDPTGPHDFMTSVRSGRAGDGRSAAPRPRRRRGVRPRPDAVAFASFLNEAPALAGRPFVAHRRPEWVALEDKTVVDALLDRAGVERAPSVVVRRRRGGGDMAFARRRSRHGAGPETPATATTVGRR